METFAWLILFFLLLRTLVSLVNLLSDLHLPHHAPVSFPKVSLLIPARNEEAVLGRLLSGVIRLDYPELEVIVCDDHSSDNTEEILNWFSGEDERLHWFLGEKLPDNWLGKNYACHQLAQKATGQYLIFLDADVELSPGAITRAVAFFQHKKLSLLSVFPQQKMETLAEWSLVPIMNWILQNLLPMLLVRTTRNSSLSAANGQFMMFETASYKHFQWHLRVKNQQVEDILLARMVKAQGLKMAVLLGNHDIYCRMYRNLEEGILGFSRNVHQYFGGSRTLMLSFYLIVIWGPVIVWMGLGWKFFVFFVGLVILNRIFVSIAARQNILMTVFLHPLQMLGFTAIVMYNIFRKVKNQTTWKGRTISLQS